MEPGSRFSTMSTVTWVKHSRNIYGPVGSTSLDAKFLWNFMSIDKLRVEYN